jgi:hypothetical protein
MDLVNAALTGVFDLILRPFAGAHPLWAIAAVAVPLGVVLVWAFGKVSNQQRIARLKRRIKGHMLEMWIFRQSPGTVLKAQGKTLANAFLYAGSCVQGFLILMVPMVLVMVQLQARYGYAPLAPGEAAVLRVALRENGRQLPDISLDVPDGVVVETPPLRVPSAGEVDFRVRADRPGRHRVTVVAGEERVAKTLSVGTRGGAVSPVRSISWSERVVHPVELRIGSGPVASVEVHYEAAAVRLWGMAFHWMWPFLLISIAAGVAVKGRLKVQL